MNKNLSDKTMMFITVILMELLSAAEISIFAPSLPEIAKVFNLSTFMVELTLSVNMIASFFSALIVGSVSDHYGRKNTLLWSIGIFVIGSAFCVYSPSFSYLLFGRFLQGIGVSGPAVVAYGIIADFYSVKDQQRMLGIVNGSLTLMMATSPVIGSYCALLFGWRGNFYLLLAMGVTSLIFCWLFIPKYEKAKNTSLLLFSEYKRVIVSKKAMYYIVVIIFVVVPFWAFEGIAPILYITDMGVPLLEYGFYQFSLIFTYSLLSFASGRLVYKFGIKKCMKISILFLWLFIFFSIILIIFKIYNPLILTLVLQFLSIGAVLPIIIMYPPALEAVPNAKGKIAAFIVAGRQLVVAICVQSTSYYHDGSFTSTGIMMIVVLLFMIICYNKLSKIDIKL